MILMQKLPSCMNIHVRKGRGAACRIAHVLPGPSAAMWLRLQYCHDVWQAEHMLAISRLRPLTLSEEEKAEAVRTRLAAEEVCAD